MKKAYPKLIKLDKCLCAACVMGKSHRRPTPKKGSGKVYRPGQRMDLDIYGPYPYASWEGYIYWLLIHDHATGMIFIHGLKEMGEAIKIQIEEAERIKVHFRGAAPEWWFADKGGPFTANKLKNMCLVNGIRKIHALPDVHQLGGVDRFGRTGQELDIS